MAAELVARRIVPALSRGPGRSELWAMPLTHDGRRVFVAGADRPTRRWERISPDGRWIAYVSFDEGTREVVVRSRFHPAIRECARVDARRNRAGLAR